MGCARRHRHPQQALPMFTSPPSAPTLLMACPASNSTACAPPSHGTLCNIPNPCNTCRQNRGLRYLFAQTRLESIHMNPRCIYDWFGQVPEPRRGRGDELRVRGCRGTCTWVLSVTPVSRASLAPYSMIWTLYHTKWIGFNPSWYIDTTAYGRVNPRVTRLPRTSLPQH